MLIEYSVENFRSIAQPITFTMLPAKGSSKANNLIKIEKNPNYKKLLKSTVIFGANASGKSNIILALNVMREMVIRSKNFNAGDNLGGYFPFALDNTHANKPTSVMVHFIKEGTEYKYSFSFDSEKIVSEELLYYIGKKEQYFFKRDSDKIESFLDSEELSSLFRNTGNNVLFLSKANNEYKGFRPVFEWFNKNIISIGTSVGPFLPILSPEYTISYMNQSDDNKKRIMNLLHHADFDIFDIVGKNIPFDSSKSLENFKTFIMSMASDMNNQIGSNDNKKINPIKIKTSLDEAPLSLSELKSVRKTVEGSEIIKDFMSFESAGTSQFFNMAGLLLNALLEENKLLVIDEFDLRLHPDLQAYLIQLFHDPDINKKDSQLIFTSHNTHLLALDIFRREQIVFTEKNPLSHATEIFSLYDYEKRQDRSLEKSYFLGRYGGLPDITYGKI